MPAWPHPRASGEPAVNDELSKISDLVRLETGVMLPPARSTALRAALGRAAPDLDAGAFVNAVSDPVTRHDLMDRLIDEVTNQETSFVRDRGQLEKIAWRGLLHGARASGSHVIRIWSAGCASGEEAYSLALLAAEAFAPGPAPVDVLGTDVSGAALAAAADGRYRERAMRALGPALRRRYFQKQRDGTYLVGEALRSLVRFRRHNLARDMIPPPAEAHFDLVTCRNVLIYFAAPLAGRVIHSLQRSLHPGGELMLGVADALHRPALLPEQRPVARPGQSRPAQSPPAQSRPAPSRPAQPGDGEGPRSSNSERLTAALEAAGRGNPAAALASVAAVLADAPLDADAHFIHGLVALESGDPVTAAAALRRALYADARFALAAFTLGRAYDELGDAPAARRAYEQALRMLDPGDMRHEPLLQQVDVGDIAAACRARIGGPFGGW